MRKKSIPFEEELAEKLQKRFNLNDITIRVWKHRKRIPAKYLEGKKPFPARASKVQEARVLKRLELPYINRAGIEGIPSHRFSDFLRKDKPVSLRKEDVKKFDKAIQQVRSYIIKFRNDPSFDNLRKLIKLPMLKGSVFLNHPKLYDQLRQESANWQEGRKEWVLELLEQRLEELRH